jgi:hypothetical protein
MRFIGITQVVAVEDGSSYSQGLAREFLKEWGADMTSGEQVPISLQVYLGTEPIPGLRPPRAFFFAASSVENAITLSRAVTEGEPQSPIFYTDTAMSEEFAQSIAPEHTIWNRFVTLNGSVSLDQSVDLRLLRNLYQDRYGEELSSSAAAAFAGVELVTLAIEELGGAAISRQGVRNSVLIKAAEIGELNRRPLLPSALGEIFLNANGDNIGASLEGYVVLNGNFRFVRRLTRVRP